MGNTSYRASPAVGETGPTSFDTQGRSEGRPSCDSRHVSRYQTASWSDTGEHFAARLFEAAVAVERLGLAPDACEARGLEPTAESLPASCPVRSRAYVGSSR